MQTGWALAKFALQLVTVRHLGMFLADPLAVPTEVVAYVAEQLDIADPACVKGYVDREKTRLEHAWFTMAAGRRWHLRLCASARGRGLR
nr:DUF4158 domain-containing protein [Nocardia miyunensis]